jgi:hypothetical protein
MLSEIDYKKTISENIMLFRKTSHTGKCLVHGDFTRTQQTLAYLTKSSWQFLPTASYIK